MSAGLGRFAELLARDQFNLAEASLLVAQDEYPDLDVAGYLGQLDAIAAAVRRQVSADAFAEQKVSALNRHLFDEMRFAGNVRDYHDPRNSYLNEVLERRTGIPLTLSILYLEVGRRLGLNVKGVAFPGHFLVRLAVEGGQLVLDPFAGGRPQTENDLRQRLARLMPAGKVERVPIERFLAPASSRQMIARMLRNLKSIHLRAGRLEQALAVMHRMLLVVPESAEELRDRGLLYRQLECFRPALSDLQNYLRRRPDAPDAAAIHAVVAELRRALARLN